MRDPFLRRILPLSVSAYQYACQYASANAPVAADALGVGPVDVRDDFETVGRASPETNADTRQATVDFDVPMFSLSMTHAEGVEKIACGAWQHVSTPHVLPRHLSACVPE